MSARISFIGAGRVGTTLARAMHAAGMKVVAVASRSRRPAEALAASIPGIILARTWQDAADAADLVFLTVSDDAIGEVCGAIEWRSGAMVVHCSGVTELDALRPAIIDAGSCEEALGFARRFMELHLTHWPTFEGECEMRPFEAETQSAS